MPKLSEKKKVGLHMLAEGQTVAEVAHALGVHVQAVYKWKAKAKHQAYAAVFAETKKPVTVEEIKQELEQENIPEDASEAIAKFLISKKWNRLEELNKLCEKGNVSAISLWLKETEKAEKEHAPKDKPAPTIEFNLTVQAPKKNFIDVTPSAPVDVTPQLQLEGAKPLVTLPEFVDDLSGLVPAKAIQDDAPAD